MIGMVHASYSTTGPSIGANEREQYERPLSEETISLRTRVLENSRLWALGSGLTTTLPTYRCKKEKNLG